MASEDPPRTGSSPWPENARGRPVRIVLVDDDAETRALLRSVLQAEGLAVIGAAGDGQEALTVVAELDPDVVLMDLRMPTMGGFPATRLIKERHPWIQVIILTFYEDLLENRDPQEVGAFAYLVKGCSPQLMRDVILQASRHGFEQRAALRA